MHTEEALAGDVETLRKARRTARLTAEEAARLDAFVVRAEHYVHVYRFLVASAKKDNPELPALGRALLAYRVAHRNDLIDAYEMVMNSRWTGTEGFSWKLIPDVLREFGGMTPREDMKEYNW